MRSANLIVVALGIVGLGSAVVIAWRWRRRPLLVCSRPVPTGHRAGALDGLHTLAVAMAAGVIAGVLVLGFGGRFVMRVLGATSGEAQGERTAANQVVGEITNGGTIAVVLFVGVLGGVIAAVAYVFVRRWLPATAGPAGVVAAVLLLGTLGVSDPLSPDNKDFAILRPTWLAITLVVALAFLFGVTFTALAARLDAGIPTLGMRPSSIAGNTSLVIYLFPALLLAAAVYVTGKAALRGRLAPLLGSPRAQRIGHVTVGIATIAAAVSGIRAISEIALA